MIRYMCQWSHSLLYFCFLLWVLCFKMLSMYISRLMTIGSSNEYLAIAMLPLYNFWGIIHPSITKFHKVPIINWGDFCLSWHENFHFDSSYLLWFISFSLEFLWSGFDNHPNKYYPLTSWMLLNDFKNVKCIFFLRDMIKFI